MSNPRPTGGGLLWRSIVCGIATISVIVVSSCRYYAWNEPGPIQVLGDGEELWFFIEVDRMVDRPGGGWDAPPVIPVGHSQELLVIDREGLQARSPIENPGGKAGVTFHPNNSRIYRRNGSFYLYEAESMFFVDSFFVWHANSFDLLPEAECAHLAAELPGDISGNWSALDDYTKQSGWYVAARDNSFVNLEFSAADGTVRVTSEIENDEDIKVTISGDYFQNIVAPIVLRYPMDYREISRREYHSLPREEPGHPK